MSTELVKIDDQQFGDLIELPKIYAASNLRLTNAKAYAQLQLSAVKLVDMETADIAFVEKLFEPVISLRSLLAEARKDIEADRKPLTSKMDAVKSAIIAVEKGFDDEIQAVADLQNKWELTKVRRKKKAAEDAANDVKKAQDKIDAALLYKNGYNANAAQLQLADLNRLSAVFYKKTAAELPAFAESLKGYTPQLDEEQQEFIQAFKIPFGSCMTLGEDEINEIKLNTWVTSFPGFADEYTERVGAEVQRFIDLVPSRIQEINEGNTTAAAARIKSEREQTENLINSALTDKTEAATMEADTDKLSTHFVASATPVITKAKGAVTKKKYVAETHKAYAALLQSWVKNDMPNLTVKELEKKLSFIVTAANSRLNAKTNPETLVADGLTVIDDISTRTQTKA